jgi:hypothetical protein
MYLIETMTDRDKTPAEIKAEAKRILHEIEMEKQAKEILEKAQNKKLK